MKGGKKSKNLRFLMGVGGKALNVPRNYRISF